MRPARKLATTTTLALLLALTACSSADPGPRSEAGPTTDSPVSSPPVGSTSADRPVDLVGLQGPLDPGSYSLAAWGESRETGPLPRAVVEVPEGFWSNGGYVIDAGLDGVSDDQRGEVSVWHPVRVLIDPCRRRTATDAGTTVRDLARALVDQAGPSTRPEPVVLDGHRGLTLEVTIPADVDLSLCSGGRYSLWRTEPRGDGALTQTVPGLVDRLWILDVDGTRLVVLATLFPDEDEALHEEQVALVESMRFQPGPRA